MHKDKTVRLLSAFVFVIKVETYSVNHAGLVINAELAKGFEAADHTVMWEAVYSILSHSANLSKVFWPPSAEPEMKRRGKLLRAMFDMGADSPLKNRDVRNGFEHMDESLHEWLADTKPDLIDQFIGATDQFERFTDRFMLRTFNYETGIVTVGDRTVALFPLIRESDQLYERWRLFHGMPSDLGERVSPTRSS